MLKKLRDGQRREITPEELAPIMKTLIRAWYEHDGRSIDWIAHEIWLREGVSKRNARALAEQIAFGTLKRRDEDER